MIRNVIFDFGNVLIDWQPRYLFLPFFGGDEAKCDYFTSHICNREWFTRIDSGETMDSCVADLQRRFPDWADAIAAFRDRWFEMIHGEIPGMLELIQELKAKGIGVYGLTNWPNETFDEARRRYKTIGSIDNIIVSSRVHLAKPGLDIYRLLLDKFGLKAGECVFIDDRADNVNAAVTIGMSGIVFPGTAEQTRARLCALGVL